METRAVNQILIRNSSKQGLGFTAFGFAVIAAKILVPDVAGELVSIGGLVGLLSLLFGVYLLIDRRPQIEISDYGFADRRLSTGPVPWEVILKAGAEKSPRSGYVYLETNPQAWGGPQRVRIRVQGLEVTPQRLVDLINERARGTPGSSPWEGR